jgi:flavin reductase (DIM6/NTAB) family NADH-FMN oxidoreductase RutF
MQSFPATSIDTYKALARTWAATVTVVTTRRKPELISEAAPELDGFTATAFLTVSMNPPIILISATNASSAFTMLRDASGFAVNLLAPEQADVAGAFAKPAAERAALWNHLEWQGDEAGVPLLAGTTGAFSARVRQLVEAGDHTLVLGDVTALHLGEGADTLVYHNRGYGKVVRQG